MIHRHRFLSMGTMITVTVCCAHRVREAEIREALAAVQVHMGRFGRDYWAWGSGRLAQINRQIADGIAAEIPDDMRPLFDRALTFHDATGGLYEPRIGELVRLWGFDDPIHRRVAPPPRAEIARRLESMARAPAWDFGGIGKGWIVDECLDLLAARGFRDATIDAGGNVAVRGRRADRPWRIGVRDPRAQRSDEIVSALDVGDEAVITHGDDQRFFEHEGVRYSHILDPRTGWPARGLRSLTVVHRDAALADAAGAALFVAGRAWRSLAAQLGLDQVMAITEDAEIEVTPALARRLTSAVA